MRSLRHYDISVIVPLRAVSGEAYAHPELIYIAYGDSLFNLFIACSG